MHPEKFAEYLRSLDRAPQTMDGYIQELALFEAWYLAEHNKSPLTETVTPLDVKAWRETMDRQGLAPATINRRLAALRAYFRWAKEVGVIQIDPTDGVRLKRQEQHGPRWLDRNELHRLRNAAQALLQVAEARKNTTTAREAKRNKAILALFIGAGLRLSELVAVKTGDIVLRERSGHVVVRAGKGDKWRIVPLNGDVRRAVQEWMKVWPESQQEALFLGRRGEPLRPSGVERIITKLARHAGLDPERVTPHTLRHSFAKALVDIGESLEKVQMLLGHESIVTTTRYTTPSDRDLATAVERIAWSG